MRVLPFATVTVFAALVPLLHACGIGDDDTSQTSMSALVPTALRDELDVLRLTVFDRNAACNGPDASGGTPLPGLEDIEFGVNDSQSITVSAGQRVFSLLGLAGETLLARGCTETSIVDDEDRDVVIVLEQVPGLPDAGP